MASSVLLVSVAGSTADRVERLLHTRGYDVVTEGDAARAAAAAPEHRLVIVEAADTARVVALTQRLRKLIGDRPPILAVAHGNDIEERVQLLEAGAEDVLAQAFDERELEALVEALLLRTTAALLPQGGAPAAHIAVRAARGQVFAFAATKGGAGATTLAVNAAVALALRPELDVALVDMDFYRGQAAMHLDIRGDLSTAQLARSSGADLSERIQPAGVRHATGVMVFPAPHRPDEGAQITPAQARAVVDEVRRQHPVVVVDAGSTIDARALALLDQADRVVLVVTPEIPALRTLHGLLEVMADGTTIADRTTFVLNQVFAKPMLAADQIEENLGVKFALQIPYHDRFYGKAVNEGEPVVTAAPRSPQARELKRLAAKLIGEEAAEEPESQPRRLIPSFRRRA